MGIRPPRKPLQTSADWDRFFRGALIDSVGTMDLQSEAVTTEKVAGAPAASNDRFYVKRSGALTFDAIALTDLPAGVATDAEVAAADAIVASDAAAALAAFAALPDPFPQYLTTAEGNAAYRAAGAVPWADLSGIPAALGLLYSGTGSPAGVVAAPVGSLFLRTDGGANTTLYVKESGAATSAGWVAK